MLAQSPRVNARFPIQALESHRRRLENSQLTKKLSGSCTLNMQKSDGVFSALSLSLSLSTTYISSSFPLGSHDQPYTPRYFTFFEWLGRIKKILRLASSGS